MLVGRVDAEVVVADDAVGEFVAQAGFGVVGGVGRVGGGRGEVFDVVEGVGGGGAGAGEGPFVAGGGGGWVLAGEDGGG